MSQPKLNRSGVGLRALRRWFADERGNIGPLLALMVVPIVGAFAIGGESASWYMYQRSQQNAADSAAMAAAFKGATGGYATEAQNVSTKNGYTNGSNDVVVTPTTVSCPAGASVVPGSTCFKVTITHKVPVYLTRVVGYRGDTTIGVAPAKNIAASAIAGSVYGNVSYCLRAANDITLNGGSGTNHPDLSGCSMLAGGNLKCNGSQPDYGVLYGDAGGTNGTAGGSGTCGADPRSGQTIPSDPISSQVSTALSRLSTPSCPTMSTLTTLSQGSVNCFTGNVTLGANINITSPNTVIVIKNGGLNLGAYNLQSAQSGSSYGSLTIVFQGTTQSSVISSSGGALNVGAPSTGDWKGLAIVEDPSLIGQTVNGGGKTSTCTSSANGSGCPQDLDFSGNSPHLYLTGAIYAPNALVKIGGSIDKATAPYPYCVAIDAKYIITSGNLTIYNDTTNNPPTSDCRRAGLTASLVPVVALLQ